MDDERMGEGQRAPLWPADSQPDLPPERAGTPPEPPVSDAPTERIPAAPSAPAPVSDAPTERIPATPSAQPTVSDAPTERIPATPAPSAPQAADIPTHRLSAPPAPPTLEQQMPLRSAPPKPSARRTPPPLPAPLRPAPSSKSVSGAAAALSWARAHWRLLTVATALLAVVIVVMSVYNYAASLAAQPARIMTSYCAALTHADYTSAYALQAPSLQAQSTLAQYKADSAARDAISGRVKTCAATPAQRLSALSFLRNPRSLIFNVTLTRAGSESGQIALSRDTTGWHVAALSAGVVGVDLGPLHTEQALCQAFVARKYDVAYALLSTPYQREQGSEKAFAHAFGANLAITGCAPALSGYIVDSADQRASFQVTLNVAVSGGGASTKLTLPAKLTLVREPDGWRVDSITPQLSQ